MAYQGWEGLCTRSLISIAQVEMKQSATEALAAQDADLQHAKTSSARCALADEHHSTTSFSSPCPAAHLAFPPWLRSLCYRTISAWWHYWAARKECLGFCHAATPSSVSLCLKLRMAATGCMHLQHHTPAMRHANQQHAGEQAADLA